MTCRVLTWWQTRDFSSRYCSIRAPSITPALLKKISKYLPKRLELSLRTVLAFPKAACDRTRMACTSSLVLCSCLWRTFQDGVRLQDQVFSSLFRHLTADCCQVLQDQLCALRLSCPRLPTERKDALVLSLRATPLRDQTGLLLTWWCSTGSADGESCDCSRIQPGRRCGEGAPPGFCHDTTSPEHRRITWHVKDNARLKNRWILKGEAASPAHWCIWGHPGRDSSPPEQNLCKSVVKTVTFSDLQ